MKRFLLDTGIFVHYARKSTLYKQIEAEQALSQPNTLSIVSVVTIAEIISFGIQHNWGQQKIQDVENLFKKLITIDINTTDNALIRAYADFDAFSENKLSGSPLGSSSITMGKNDLWIAATAYVANATLITIDGDFDHLHGKFIQVVKYQQH